MPKWFATYGDHTLAPVPVTKHRNEFASHRTFTMYQSVPGRVLFLNKLYREEPLKNNI